MHLYIICFVILVLSGCGAKKWKQSAPQAMNQIQEEIKNEPRV